MKKFAIFTLAAIMVLGLAISAHAVPTISDTSGETYLYQIFQDPLFNGGVYGSSQAIANAVPILETLPAGLQNFKVTAYATFAGFAQNPGAYPTANPSSLGYFSPTFTNAFPATTDGIFAITDWPNGLSSNAQFGFFDDTTASGGDIKYTQLALNSGNLSQSNGLIFQISANHYIVAFEDGAGVGRLGDSDYNDLVLNIQTSAVPVPPSALLMGSGLFGMGLLGWRRRFSRQA
jgi:hypothetical protein